jgi:LexA-binding, inner membrane-associated putative hydrolase
MFVLGHAGIAVGIVHAIDRKADLRWVPVAALLPDLIDKPIWLLLPGFANGWTRNVAHSVTGLAVFTILVTACLGRRAWPYVLAYASHLILDRMWFDSLILTWPLEGFFLPKYRLDHMELFWEKFTDLWTMGGEAVGGSIFLALAVRGRLWDPARRRSFWATGQIPPLLAAEQGNPT